MQLRNPYSLAGLVSLLTGGLLVVLGQFIVPVNWVVALGIVLLIMAFIFFVLGRTVPRLPPAYSHLLLQTGLNNIASLIEELGISTRAVYLPPHVTGGQPRALIPLHDDISPHLGDFVPDRLIVRYGENPDDIGLLVTTVGTAAVAMLKQKPGRTLPEMETALTSLMAGTLGVADGASVSESDGHLVIEISQPHIELEETRAGRCLGGPLASLVAAVAAYSHDRPVQVTGEEKVGRGYRVTLKVLA